MTNPCRQIIPWPKNGDPVSLVDLRDPLVDLLTQLDEDVPVAINEMLDDQEADLAELRAISDEQQAWDARSNRKDE